MPSRTRRTVFTLSTRSGRCAHEATTHAWIARQLATLFEWEYGGEYRPGEAPPDAFFVPDDTLTSAQAAALGIAGEGDLFGGVVPHGFVASKVITHPLPSAGALAPHGWDHGLATRLGDAVLPGFSVFEPADIGPAGLRLLGGGGIRLKEAAARGGHGQYRVADAMALRMTVAELDPERVRHDGVVLELDLADATTCSVGEVRIGGLRLAYLGTQHQVRDREGDEVYGGSALSVVEGGLDALEKLPLAPAARAALRQARRYDAAVAATWPGFFASRRNYDVVCGHDGGGRWRCGVLEQSWRVGGASPAEMVALAAFLGADPPLAVEVSCHESHDPAEHLPAGAEVHFSDPAAASGPVLKYALAARRLHADPA